MHKSGVQNSETKHSNNESSAGFIRRASSGSKAFYQCHKFQYAQIWRIFFEE